MIRISHALLAALVLAVLLATIGCGGGGNENALSPNRDVASGYGFELITEQIASLDSSLVENSLSMELKELKGNAVKAIVTANGKSITGAAFAVEYDMNALTPIRVETGDFLGSDILELSMLDLPGEVPVAMTQMAPFTAPSTGSGIVAEIYFEKEANRTISGVPGGLPPTAPINDLVATYNVGTGEVTLTCSSPMMGDVNGDGRVSGPDVLYIGAHMGESITGVAPYSAADCIDSDEDGFVSTGDIFNVAVHYREEEDGLEFFKSSSDTVLGPYEVLDQELRPDSDGSDPAWDYCQPVYGMDTLGVVDIPDHFPYFYKAAAFYTDSDTGLTAYGPDSNFATGDNVVYLEVDADDHSYGNSDDIIVSFNVGALEATDNMTVHVSWDATALDTDPSTWVMGDFFGVSQAYTIFYTPGTGFMDVAISDINNPASGNGWLGDLTFEIIQDDYQSNLIVGIDPLQGSFFEDALGVKTQFSAVGDTWAMWGDGHRPALGTPQCYRFFDTISEGDGTGNWDFWSAPDDQAEDTYWHFTDISFCSGPNSMWFGEVGSNPPTYGDRAHDYVDSIPIDLTDFSDPEGPIPSLTFKYWHNFENIIPPVDYAKLWISSYPYSTWDEIEVFSGDSVPDGIGDDPENPNPCPDWTSFSYSLENYLGQNIKLRFEGKSDFSNPQPFQGMAIDDVAVGFAGAGGSSVKKLRLLVLGEHSSDSYGSWAAIPGILEDMGLEEVTDEDDVDDDTFFTFYNYSSTYESYFMDEELLSNFNAIWAYNRGSYTGTLWGSQDERDMLEEWLIDQEEGRLFVFNCYHYAPRALWYSSSYPNYDPQWAQDFIGLVGDGSAYWYCRSTSSPSYWEAEAGEEYEDLDGETLYSYTGSSTSSVYAYDWDHDEDTTHVLAWLGDWDYLYNSYNPDFTGPAANAWLKDDNGAWVFTDTTEPIAIDTDVAIARAQIWFDTAGFVLPDMGESWDPETGDCVVDDVLPSPSAGPGFGWGGGVYEGGGTPPGAEPIRMLILQDFPTDSYSDMAQIITAFEDLGLEEDTDAGDGKYVIFDNYDSGQNYFFTPELLEDFNAIWQTGATYTSSKYLANDQEREDLLDWIQGGSNRMYIGNQYYSVNGYFTNNTYQYDPVWAVEFLGLDTSLGYTSYSYSSPTIIATSGEMYEDLDGEPIYNYSGSTSATMRTLQLAASDPATVLAAFGSTSNAFAWVKEHDGSYVIWDSATPNSLDPDNILLRAQLWFENCGFELP